MKRASIMLLALALIMGGAAQSKADFINGSFETGDLTGWGGTATTDVYGLNPFGTTYGSGMDGTYWMWLAGYEVNRTLNQTLTGLTPGNIYHVDFIMASEATNSDSLNVSADGGPQTLFTAPPINSANWDNWVSQTFTFTAGGTSAFIEFSSVGLNTNGFDVGLDNVRLREASAVPEPSTLALAGLGGLGLLGYLRRRQRS